MSERQKFEVELHSTDPSAVESTRTTIMSLGGFLYEDDGRYYVDSFKADFLKFALQQQGYVRRVIDDAAS